MRVLIACDKFKGSLTALQACQAVARGLTLFAETYLVPIADGGEGFVDAMLAACPGKCVEVPCQDPLGRPVSANYGIHRSGSEVIAFLEMAASSGLARVAPAERDILHSSTYGTGQMLRHAVEQSHATKVVVGIGGSGTSDGGAGMAAALGVRFLDVTGRSLSGTPASLGNLDSIDETGRIALPPITAACDVTNPLTGPSGAAAIFGPQKGAGPREIETLDRIMQHLARVSKGEELAGQPGSGAAGGLGFGLRRFAGARLCSGFSVVAEASGLRDRIAASDLVITGEGSLDAQTLAGKAPAGVAELARECGIPVVAVAGRICDGAGHRFDAALSLESMGLSLEESLAHAGRWLEELIRRNTILLREIVDRCRGTA